MPGPKKLSARHMTMAALIATGLTDREVATRLGLNHHTVKITRQSPLFQLELARLTRRASDTISDRYVDQVMQDGTRNVAFLKRVRDGKLTDFDDMTAADRVRLRMSAALPLFDRQLPKQREGDQAPAVTIVLQRNEQTIMAESLRDVGVRIPQLDEIIATYEHDEAEALRREQQG